MLLTLDGQKVVHKCLDKNKHFICLYVLLMCMCVHFLETKYQSNINEVAALSIFEFLKENVIHYNIWKCNTQCNIFQIS